MPKLAILSHEEGVMVNPDPLVALYAELGEGGAERVINRAIGELASRTAELARFADERQEDAVARSARLMVKVADQLGMSTLARVAADLAATTEAGDRTAQAAVLARLTRIGERSLSAVWDLRDMTM